MSKPTDKTLYESVKRRIYKKIPKHSAYRSGLLVKEYKEAYKKKHKKSNAYSGKKTKQGLTKWYKERWVNQRGEVGYKTASDIYRPTIRVTKKTPTTISELSKKQITIARREKKSKGRVSKFNK